MHHFLPFQQAEPALVRVGVIPLVAIGAFAAFRRRSWGLGFLAAAGAFGLLESELLQSQFAWHDRRIYWLALAVATIGALVGVAWERSSARCGEQAAGAWQRRRLVCWSCCRPAYPGQGHLPVAGAHVALRDLEVVDPAADASGHRVPARGSSSLWSRPRSCLRAYFGELLEANWEFYAWLHAAVSRALGRSTTDRARLRAAPRAAALTSFEHAPVSASAAGVASPTSHRDYQMFLFGYTTWVYEDALRFLHRDDLADLGVTHLHVTDQLEADFAPSARRLLGDPRHFRLLAEVPTSSGERHRVFEVQSGAGTTEVDPSSYRALRQLVPQSVPVATLGSLSHAQRLIVMSAFPDHEVLQSSIPLRFERATRIPQVETLRELPASGMAITSEPLDPIALAVARSEALWTGHALRAYDLATAWSPLWRIGRDPAALPGPARSVCESAGGEVDLHLLGEPGTTGDGRLDGNSAHRAAASRSTRGPGLRHAQPER